MKVPTHDLERRSVEKVVASPAAFMTSWRQQGIWSWIEQSDLNFYFNTFRGQHAFSAWDFMAEEVAEANNTKDTFCDTFLCCITAWG